MATGTVKWFDPNRGYGFIRPEQGEDVFGLEPTATVQRRSVGWRGRARRQMRPTQDGAGA
jgi:'Cold-shock' DNA-binding domain